jgi:membrane-bound serine protease (ClpP class)
VVLVALAVLVVVAVSVAVGFHAGPHGVLAAGALGAIATVAFIVAVEVAPARSRPALEWVLLGATAAVSASAIVAGAVTLPALRRRQPAVGSNRLLGADGVAVSDLTPAGTVRVLGETWTAESVSGRLPAGAAIHVMEVDGLRLRVWSEAAVGAGGPGATADEEQG